MGGEIIGWIITQGDDIVGHFGAAPNMSECVSNLVDFFGDGNVFRDVAFRMIIAKAKLTLFPMSPAYPILGFQ